MKLKLSIFLTILALSISCKKDSKVQKVTSSESQKPNIILILSDDQGWGDLSYTGNTNIKTPNIDGLATNGVSFENFFVQPVCSPTRAELLMGRHYPLTGVYSTSAGSERMNFDDTIMAEALKTEGYATAAYGIWHKGTTTIPPKCSRL